MGYLTALAFLVCGLIFIVGGAGFVVEGIANAVSQLVGWERGRTITTMIWISPSIGGPILVFLGALAFDVMQASGMMPWQR